MAQITTSHPIVDRLSNLRRRVRMLLTLHGTGLLIGSVFSAALVLAVADYLIHFRPATRIVLLVVVVAALAALAFRRLIAPLSTKLTEQFLASRVENVNRDLADELISAVHFIRQGTPQANALAAKAVEAAEARARGIRFEDALDFRPALRVMAVGLVIALVTVLAAIINPASAAIAFDRWLSPLGGATWPRQMHVEFVWDHMPGGVQPAVLPQGEQIEIRARVKGPNAQGARVFLYSSTDATPEAYDVMTRQDGLSTSAEALFARQIEPIGNRRISLRVVSGDDTEQAPIYINLARRPEIRELAASVTPPAYVRNHEDPAKPAAPRHYDLLQQTARAVEESTVRLLVRSTNAFLTNAAGEPDVRFLEQSKDVELPVARTARLLDPNTAEITLPARQTLMARVQVRDTNAFENRVGGSMTLDVVPDAMPSVVITEPRQAIRCAPTALLNIGVAAVDDLGVSAGKWQAIAFDAKPDAAPRYDKPLDWTGRSEDAAAGNFSTRSDFKWDISALNLKPNDRLTLYAMVQDNYDINGKRHDWVKSAPLSLTIISEDQVREEARTDLMDVRNRIEQLNRQTEATNALTKAIQKTIADTNTSTPEQAKNLGELAQQQAQQAASAKGLEQKLGQIESRLAQNKMAESELGKVADFAKTAMKDVGQNNMTKASSELGKAQDSANKAGEQKSSPQEKSDAAKDAAKSAENASGQQSQAMATMQDVMKKLDEHNNIGKARDDLNRLIAEQANVQKQIQDAKQDPKLGGAKRDELSKDSKDKLDNIARKQDDLQKQTANAIQNMKKMAENMKSDPAAKESLEKSAKSGEDAKVTDSQGSASDQAKNNQLNNANSSAGKAKAGLEKMKDELDQISKRQLEQLSQELANLIQRLQRHVNDQTAVQADTDKAGKDAAKLALRPLGDRQGTLHLGTIETQKKAEATRDVPRAAPPLIKAGADKMQTSATALFTGKQPDALPPMAEAISSLNAAIKELEKKKKDVDDEIKDKDLAYFIKQYEEIKAGEIEVKQASDAVAANLAANKELGKRDSITLADKAKQQDDLISRINGLSKDDKLKDYEAVLYINAQISEYMTESKNRLAKALVGKELAWNQQKAIDRLQDLIDALKEEKSKKDDFEKPPNDGGGGGGGDGKPPLIPPAQQLKLLKALQVVVNKDTVERGKEMDAAKADAEKHAVGEHVKKLGDQQNKIQDIAKKVVEKLKG